MSRTAFNGALVNEQAPRPAPRTLLPFRARSGYTLGKPGVDLDYDGSVSVPDGRGGLREVKQVYTVVNAENLPLGVAILSLMRLFYDMEAAQDGVKKERDELKATVAEQQNMLMSMEKKLSEANRTKGLKKE